MKLRPRTTPSSPRPDRAEPVTTIVLRTGKIHAGKASAAEIRRAVGVTKADERQAARALASATRKHQAPAT